MQLHQVQALEICEARTKEIRHEKFRDKKYFYTEAICPLLLSSFADGGVGLGDGTEGIGTISQMIYED